MITAIVFVKADVARIPEVAEGSPPSTASARSTP